MRVLFVASPLVGHLFPMMPLAIAFANAGHTVTIATGGDAVVARRSGIEVEDVWPAMSLRSAVLRGLVRDPRAVVRSGAGLADAESAGGVFAQINRPAVTPVVELSERLRPDLVVHEPFAACAAVAAARCGSTVALHNIAFDNGVDIVAATLRRLGSADDAPDHHVLSIVPPSIASVPGLPMQYVPYSQSDGPTPDWLSRPPEKPRVLVTRSTMLGDGPDRMIAAVLDAAPEVDAEFVIVRPNRPVQQSTDLPSNVRTVGWTELDVALEHCTAMINHGGAGSIYAALRAGVPQIATPAPGDRRWNATLLARRGLGMALRPGRITAERIATLISDERMSAVAKAVAAEMAAMPSPAGVVDRLVASVGS